MKNNIQKKLKLSTNRSIRFMFLTMLFTALFFSISAQNQQGRISGIVQDQNGESLIGVSVMIKGTNHRTITNIEGHFSLPYPPDAKGTLVFSYVGYQTQEINFENNNNVTATLIESNKMLDEVVVVGYGTQRKSDLTGSVSSVKADDMNAIPTTSVAEMLRGQSAGIMVTQNTARPGGSSNIVIRGKKSLTGGNAPLFIVDGVPVTNIDDFNSQDILSVEVLKDASSQAIYGARASNGVVLITTKKGAENKTTVDFSAYYGNQTIKRNFDFYNGDEWIQLKREANRSYPEGVYLDDGSLFGNMYQNLVDKRYTNWENLMIKPATQQKYDLSVRGGTNLSRIAASIGYFDQEGMVAPATFNRTTFRFNADHKLSKKITVGINMSYTASNATQEDGSFNKFITQSPLLSPTDEFGMLIPILANSKWNPIWNNQNMVNESKADRLLLNGIFDWEIIENLKYRLNVSLNSRNAEQGIYLNSKHESGSNTFGQATLDIKNSKDYLLENILTYDHILNQYNKFDITLVQSANSILSKSTQMNGYGFTTDDLSYNNIGAASQTDPTIRSVIPRNLLSYMGRLRYNLMDKYLFSASARIDGSSVFGVNNKWGIFPATSFAWRISEEDFLVDKLWLSNLKLRLSYGAVGNQAINPYQSQGLVNTFFMKFGTEEPFVGYLPGSQLPNPNLKWETTASFNTGLDFGFLRDRIMGTIEFYNSTTKDLLVNKSINQVTGYTSQLVNMGQVRNRGVEFTLNVVPIKHRDFTWNVDLNLSANRNKIIALNNELDEDGNFKNDLANRWFIGHNIDAYYDYKFDGIWQTDDQIPDYGPNYRPKPGDIRVTNVNNDSIISPEDRIIIDREPRWTAALSSTFKWKGVDFSFDFYTVQGGIRSNAYLYDANSGGDLHGNLNGIKVDYWTLENPSNTAPRARDATIEYFSSLSYQDASYIRLRNISLGYSFPKKIISPLMMSNLRIYTSATNFWTQTKFLSYSPEISAGGYPEPKTLIVGLNVSF